MLYGVSDEPTWYFGGTSFSLFRINEKITSKNVDSLYLNIFVKSDESLPNAGAQIGFQAKSINYFIQEDVNWIGWELLSFKLSDFKSSSGSSLQTTSVDNFVLQFGAQPVQARELRVSYDFAITTYGAPLFD